MPRSRRQPAQRPQPRRPGPASRVVTGSSAVNPIDITDSEEDSDFEMDTSDSESGSDIGSDVGSGSALTMHERIMCPLGFLPFVSSMMMLGGGGGSFYESSNDMSEDEDAASSDDDGIVSSAEEGEEGEGAALPLDEFSISSALPDHTKLPADHRTCLVCQEDFRSGETTRRLNCFHLFHTKCVDKWLERRPSCPICKHHFTRKRMEEDEEALMTLGRSTPQRTLQRTEAGRRAIVGCGRARASRSLASPASSSQSSAAGLSPSSSASDTQGGGLRLRSGRQLPSVHQ